MIKRHNKTDMSATVTAVDPWSFKVAYRRLGWMLRLSVAGNVALMGGMLALSAALIELMPLKEIRPALLRADPADNRIYRIEPINQNVDGFELLLEQMARRYVTLILTIDEVSQASRMSEAARMTGSEYFETYRKTHFDNGFLERAHKDNLNRSVVVTGTSQVSQRDGVWQFAVDFNQIDRRNNEIVSDRPLRAYLSLTTRPEEVSEQDLYSNPLGVVVLDVAIKDRRAS